MDNYTSIIEIPGIWKSRTEIIHAVTRNSGGYIFAGVIMTKIGKDDEVFEVDVHDFDPNQEEHYRENCRGTISGDDLNAIGDGALRVSVKTKLTSEEDLWKMVDAVQGLLNSGGLAVGIVTTGVIHSKEAWEELVKSRELYPLYRYFVIGVHGDGYCSTYGMASFGLPDVRVKYTKGNLEDIGSMLDTFNLYHIIDRPTFDTGNTFSEDEKGKIYSLEVGDDVRTDENSIYHNFYGLITLTEKKKSIFSMFKR